VFKKLRKTRINFLKSVRTYVRPSVRMEQWAPTERIVTKIDI